jgi:hypothetical protein
MILQEERDDENGDKEQGFDGGQQGPIRSAAAGRHGLVHGHGHSARIGACQQERKEKLVPGEDEAEDEGRGKTRDDLRQADLQEDPGLGRPVDTSRILDVRRKLIEDAFIIQMVNARLKAVEQDDAGIGAGRPTARNIKITG